MNTAKDIPNFISTVHVQCAYDKLARTSERTNEQARARAYTIIRSFINAINTIVIMRTLTFVFIIVTVFAVKNNGERFIFIS